MAQDPCVWSLHNHSTRSGVTKSFAKDVYEKIIGMFSFDLTIFYEFYGN